MTEFERKQAFSYLDGVADGLNESRKDIVKELEQIKAEIELLKPNNPNFEHYVGETRAINNALDILDKHIKENKE